jgi:hypothetical protein
VSEASGTLFGELSSLAKAYAELGQFDNAWHCIGEAMVETTKETWFEADVHRIAGEIALKSPEPHAAKAEDSGQAAARRAARSGARWSTHSSKPSSSIT